MAKSRLTEALAAQDWSDIHARLVKFALNHGAPPATAKDVAQEVVARVFAFDSTWDPDAQPVVLKHLLNAVRTLLYNERRARKRLVSHDHHDDDGELTGGRDFADTGAVDESRFVEGDLQARRFERLAALLGRRGDTEALRVAELMVDGHDTPADLVAATGWSTQEVARARDRVQRAALEIARELGGEEDEEVAE